MLNTYEIIGLCKHGQANDISFSDRARQEPVLTLADLVQAVRADRGLTDAERNRLLTQIRGLVGGVGDSTPLSSLMYKGLGGILGYAISKYFGMGTTGRLLSAVAGFGLGRVLYNKINKPPVDPYAGYKLLS